MINDIQKMIKELKFEEEKAQSKYDSSKRKDEYTNEVYYGGMLRAFSLCIQKLTLLLESENEKQR